ncbi:MAG: SDR family oxidoreductase [Nannocystaceae bacterium]|nr:SDR family oxidoreductase [bacterium]
MTTFVTGGSRGIGRGIVQAALQAGHDVAFTYRSNRAAAEEVVAWARAHAPQRRCEAFALDVRDPVAVEAVGDAVLDAFDEVATVVNNAGIVANELAAHMSDARWAEVLGTNLSGAFYVSRAFLPSLLASGGGSLVFVGSIAADGMAGQAAYAASKAGLVGLAKSLAKEYGRKGITANVVVPGFIDSDMTRESMPTQLQAFWAEFCPLRRMGSAGEVADAVLFLASDAARFINGHTLCVTGGLEWAP